MNSLKQAGNATQYRTGHNMIFKSRITGKKVDFRRVREETGLQRKDLVDATRKISPSGELIEKLKEAVSICAVNLKIELDTGQIKNAALLVNKNHYQLIDDINFSSEYIGRKSERAQYRIMMTTGILSYIDHMVLRYNLPEVRNIVDILLFAGTLITGGIISYFVTKKIKNNRHTNKKLADLAYAIVDTVAVVKANKEQDFHNN